MKAVAKAHQNRSLADFEQLSLTYKARKSILSFHMHCLERLVPTELSDDPIIRNHLTALYDTVLEQNLVRIIEPYSRVEISYIADQVKQPTREVEAKYVDFSVAQLAP